MLTLTLLVAHVVSAKPPAPSARGMTVQSALAAVQAGKDALVLKQLPELIAGGTLSPADLATAHACLGASLLATGRAGDAAKSVEALLDVAPDVDLAPLKLKGDFVARVETQRQVRASARAAAAKEGSDRAAQAQATVKQAAEATPAHEAPRPRAVAVLRLAVLDPQTDGDATAKKAISAYAQATVAELNKLGAIQVISMADIREMLGFERQNQILGCSDAESESCLSELAGSAGADELLSTQVTFVGKTQTVTVRRLSMKSGRAVQSDTRTLDRGDGGELMALVGPQVQALFPDKELKPGKTRGVDKETLSRLIPPPLPRWIFFTTAGAAVLSGVGGAFMGLQVRASQDGYASLAAQSLTTPQPGSELKRLERKGKEDAQVANGLFIGAGVLAGGALAVSFLTNWHSGDTRVAFAPTAGGAAFALAGTF